MRTFFAVAVIMLLVVLTIVSFSCGWLGNAVVQVVEVNVEQGERLNAIGRGKGYLPEWGISGDLNEELKLDFYALRPKQLLLGEEAATEHLIEKLTDDVLSDLPPELAESAKKGIAPALYIGGEITCDPPLVGSWAVSTYKIELKVRFRAKYYDEMAARNASSVVVIRVVGFYPIARLREKAASLLAKQLSAMIEKSFEDETEYSNKAKDSAIF